MEIFGNEIKSSVYNKAVKTQKKFIRKFGDDRKAEYHLELKDNDVLTPPFGCKVIVTNPSAEEDSFEKNLPEKPMIIGNIRMGFGHYRISMAMASFNGNGKRCKSSWLHSPLDGFEFFSGNNLYKNHFISK